MFGAKESDITHFLGKTMSDSIDELLLAPAQPLPPVNDYSATVNDPDVAAGQTWVNAPINFTTPGVQTARMVSWKAWWLRQQVEQPRAIMEKMVLFWHNHFAVESNNVGIAQALYTYSNTLRQYALGNTKAFVKAITIDTAMLRYLNGYLNTNTAPDENYARELQELFTVGKGAGSFYTESDVKAAARILTGYRINILPLGYFFDPTKHDTSNKTFSAFYNNTVIQGKTGLNGQQELDTLLDMIFSVDEVSKHICRKLYQFFVYYEIDAAVEANVIAPLAAIFRNNTYEIQPVLSALFKSEHFYDAANIGCVIKNPLDFVVGMMREFGVSLPPNTNLDARLSHSDNLRQQAWLMQMGLGDPPHVAGWYAYHQQPMFHEAWINSDTLPKRIEFLSTMLGNGFVKSGYTTAIDVVAYANTLVNPADANDLIAEAVQRLYTLPISVSSQAFLKTNLTTGQPDQYWSDAWNTYLGNPTDATARNVVETRLRALFSAMMSQAEYQLC